MSDSELNERPEPLEPESVPVPAFATAFAPVPVEEAKPRRSFRLPARPRDDAEQTPTAGKELTVRAEKPVREPKPAKEPKVRAEKPAKEPKPVREPKIRAEKPAKEPKPPRERPVKEPRIRKEKPSKDTSFEANVAGWSSDKGRLPDVPVEAAAVEKTWRPKWAQYERNPRKGEVAESVRSLGVMLSTSRGETVPLMTLAEQYKGTELGSAYGRIYQVVQSGQMDLAEAFRAESKMFPKVVGDLVTVGIRSGATATNLLRAADILDEGQDLNGKIKAAVLQPSILLGVIIAFMYAVIFFFLPPFAGMFKQLGKPLPPLSRAIMIGGDVLGWAGLAAVVLTALWIVYYKVWGHHIHQVRLWIGRFQLSFPVIGKVVQAQKLTQMFATLSGLLSVGMSERDALLTAAEACSNYALKDHLRNHTDKMEQGEGDFADIAEGKLIPLQAGFMLRNGFDAGQEVRAINDLASLYRRDANKRAINLTQALEPIANGAVSLIMGLVVVATYLPVYDLFTGMTAT